MWLTDLTEHPTDEGKLYLCAIKDVYSNRAGLVTDQPSLLECIAAAYDQLCCVVAAGEDVVEAAAWVVQRSGTASSRMCRIRP